MRFLISFILLFSVVSTALGQSSDSHLKGGEDETSKRAIQSFKSTPYVQGFRICLFNGSDQNARSEARAALDMCRNAFPDIDGEIVYEAPIFKVLVGACLNRIEATRLHARISQVFHKAFIVSASIPVSGFLKKEVTMPADSTGQEAEQ